MIPQVSDLQRQELERWLRRQQTAQALAFRARIILQSAPGSGDQQVAGSWQTTRTTVGKWRRRFLAHGCGGWLDAPRSGARRTVAAAGLERVLVRTLETRPRAATQWNRKSMAQACGLSASGVARSWRAFGLQPQRKETFQLSRDPLCVEQVRASVGLDLHPPQRAVVPCGDEKSQVQALDRTRPAWPLRPGVPERHTHDDRRHGTTSLCAARNLATGAVTGKCRRHHRAVEFQRFPALMNKSVPETCNMHLFLDNDSPHRRR